jgi:hypothetical protein
MIAFGRAGREAQKWSAAYRADEVLHRKIDNFFRIAR